MIRRIYTRASPTDLLREDHVVIENDGGQTFLLSELFRTLARAHFERELGHLPTDRDLLETTVPPAYGGTRRDRLVYVTQLPPYGDFAFCLRSLDEEELLRLTRVEAKTILWARGP